MNFSYEIDEDFTALIWANPDKAGAPFIAQDKSPNGFKWNSTQESEEWALEFIANYNKPTEPEPEPEPEPKPEITEPAEEETNAETI